MCLSEEFYNVVKETNMANNIGSNRVTSGFFIGWLFKVSNDSNMAYIIFLVVHTSMISPQ